MPDIDYRESQFEADIEAYLLAHGGYQKGNPTSFDRKAALDVNTLITFIQSTQESNWKQFAKIYGAGSEAAFIDRFTSEVRQVGLLRVLRQGFMDRGIKFRVVYWKPETTLNTKEAERHQKNILHCTRQLHYSLANENSVDIVLFVNGIPVVSMELKNQFTGQDASNAIRQYKFDRSPRDMLFEFKQRVLVHFAVDLYSVYMATRLQGADTYFLPFNQGSNGAGNVGGAGNPQTDGGYQTAYLWEQVLTRDGLLEILHKYMHLMREESQDKKTGKKTEKETMIFPRYHQLDAVTKLLNHVKENGAGSNYLIQHSAGSGKSNSIAWLAHRLSGLHDENDRKIFKSVVIVTDRKVLDSQLQDTVYQFDHVDGLVQKIDKNSVQLRDSINAGVPIIITTLQKFPVIYKEVKAEHHNYAVIVDEAHSSQTGEAARKLKTALADTEAALEEYARLEREEEEAKLDDQDRLIRELSTHGQHKNLSFFAFTATPKEKTLQLFGVKEPDGSHRAFHIYSMKQAIEEGFILDVLKNYMTYAMYFKIAKEIPDDPELDTTQGAKAVRRFESLHPHNIAQKTMVMLEHFKNVTLHQMNGTAKAMVVTASRLHAVRYLLEFRRQLADKKDMEIKVLVAFSGEVTDNEEKNTEEGLNVSAEGQHIKESQLKKYFHDDFNVLIVAEKYQTGFDEPLLHTMFVDKKLSGVKAVQTLSRLNRTARGKESTFVLDFVNTAEEMKKSFEPYYEATVLTEETSPNILYKLKNTLDDFHVYAQMEVDRFADVFYGSGENGQGLGTLSSLLSPAKDRFQAKPLEERDAFQTALARFVRLYAFVTQVCRMFDRDLHRFSVYARFLLKALPKDAHAAVSVDDMISMEYYKLQKSFEGGIPLKGSDEGFTAIKGESGGKEKKKETLSQIIQRINERFGTTFQDMDKVLLQLQGDCLKEDRLVQIAQNNDEGVFGLVFDQDFVKIMAQRYEQNNSFFKHLFSDTATMQFFTQQMKHAVYQAARKMKTS